MSSLERLTTLRALLQDIDALPGTPHVLRERIAAGLRDLSHVASEMSSVPGASEEEDWASTPFVSPSKAKAPAAASLHENHLPTRVVAEAKAAKELAAACLAAKDFAGALSLCDRCVALQPGEATHYANRSLAHLRLGQSREAADDAAAAVRLRPDWGRAHFRLGAALAAAGDPAGAAASLRASLEFEPNSSATKKMLKDANATLEAVQKAAAEKTAAEQAAAAIKAAAEKAAAEKAATDNAATANAAAEKAAAEKTAAEKTAAEKAATDNAAAAEAAAAKVDADKAARAEAIAKEKAAAGSKAADNAKKVARAKAELARVEVDLAEKREAVEARASAAKAGKPVKKKTDEKVATAAAESAAAASAAAASAAASAADVPVLAAGEDGAFDLDSTPAPPPAPAVEAGDGSGVASASLPVLGQPIEPLAIVPAIQVAAPRAWVISPPPHHRPSKGHTRMVTRPSLPSHPRTDYPHAPCAAYKECLKRAAKGGLSGPYGLTDDYVSARFRGLDKVRLAAPLSPFSQRTRKALPPPPSLSL